MAAEHNYNQRNDVCRRGSSRLFSERPPRFSPHERIIALIAAAVSAHQAELLTSEGLARGAQMSRLREHVARFTSVGFIRSALFPRPVPSSRWHIFRAKGFRTRPIYRDTGDAGNLDAFSQSASPSARFGSREFATDCSSHEIEQEIASGRSRLRSLSAVGNRRSYVSRSYGSTRKLPNHRLNNSNARRSITE